ncbi:MAG TPA: DNA polymerase I [Thermotogae bacterium]|nr:polymerase [Thermotogota bacterium]HCZ06412.1 DNA polymerase I [Thermotogota bacterium]
MKKLFLFDGTGLAYRAYFALDPSLATSKGLPTNAVYGMARMMIRFLKDWFRDGDEIYAVVAFDKKTVTYRHQLLEQYKAQRPETPDNLIVQLPYIKKLVKAMGFHVVEVENFEADDAIATLAVKGKEHFDEIYIVTMDKDFLQLVNDKIKILRTVKGVTGIEVYDREKVIKEYGVTPEQIVDYLALSGDTADNVPGVKGIGPKTAQTLLKDFGNIDGIYTNIRALSPRLRRLLIDGKQMVELSRKLVQLSFDAPVSAEWEQYRFRGFKEKELLEVLKELEFSSIMNELDLHDDSASFSVEIIESIEKLEKLEKDLEKAGVVSFDIETSSLDPYEAEIVGLSLAFKSSQGYYIPVWQMKERGISGDQILKILKPVLESSVPVLVGQNLKYDFSILMVNGVEPGIPKFDTMIAAHLINPNEKRFNLDELAMKFLGYKMITYEEVTSGVFGGDFRNVPVEKAARYSVEDAVVAFRLFEVLSKRLYEEDLLDVLERVEMPLINVLTRMELNGVYVDVEYLKELSKKYELKMTEIAEKIFEITGERFNINSPSQVAHVLFEKLGIKPLKKTKGGQYSTNAEVLEELAETNEVARYILEYRKYQKLKSTYVDALPGMVNPKTGRIHTSFHQTGTATGRLSSSEPNMQNLPKRDEESKEIRKAVTPQEKGWKILSADYSQIELRVLAHLSGDENLINAFKEGKDIHRTTASKIFGVDESQVDDWMRSVGKMVNFAIVYGVTPYGLSSRTNLSREEASKIISNYFSSFPKVREYVQKCIQEAKQKGYIRTMFGRKRDIPQLRSKNKNVVQEGERIAINTPVQGTAAEIMKVAMIEVDKKLRGKKTKMILQVHDELVFEVPEEELEEIKEIITHTMENCVKLAVPLKVDIEVGDHWS